MYWHIWSSARDITVKSYLSPPILSSSSPSVLSSSLVFLRELSFLHAHAIKMGRTKSVVDQVENEDEVALNSNSVIYTSTQPTFGGVNNQLSGKGRELGGGGGKSSMQIGLCYTRWN